MPKSRKLGKKGKGRKGKKKGKKTKKDKPTGPPLHDLTDLYKKLIDALRTLYEMRATARKKRIEGWFITKEMMDLKNDNALYRDYLNDNIEDLENEIAKFQKLIQDIRDAIAKAVAERMAKLQKLLDGYESRAAEIEEQLRRIRSDLLEFEGLMIELAKLLARIEELLKEIEQARIKAEFKIRHLINQFLEERGRLHKHLEEQLFNLIKFCRSYLMRVLWNFMQKLKSDNLCLRWKLAKADEKNIFLADKREDMMKTRKILTLEKPYWDIRWAFFKLNEIDAALKIRVKKKREAAENTTSAFANIHIGPDVGNIDAVSQIVPTTQLGKDFNVFLIQRLTAAKEAQERHEREKKREEKRFLKRLLESAQAQNEGKELEEDYEDEDDEEEEWENEEEEEEEEEEEDEEYDDYGQFEEDENEEFFDITAITTTQE